jgi:hypothetical protein
MLIDWINARIANALWSLLSPFLTWAVVFFAIVVAAVLLWRYLRD